LPAIEPGGFVVFSLAGREIAVNRGEAVSEREPVITSINAWRQKARFLSWGRGLRVMSPLCCKSKNFREKLITHGIAQRRII
jgi:hypothetical protein